jgi:hypothetical protein
MRLWGRESSGDRPKKKTRTQAEIERFRTWWLGLDPGVRQRNADRLRNVAGIAEAMLKERDDVTVIVDGTPTKVGFGEALWRVLFACGTAFFAYSVSPGELIAELREGVPELWGVIAPFLPDRFLADQEAKR